MSSSTTNPLARLQRFADAFPVTGSYRLLTAPVRMAAFWTAILAPSLYLAAFAAGIEGGDLVPLSTLAVANAAALIVGHGHNRPERR